MKRRFSQYSLALASSLALGLVLRKLREQSRRMDFSQKVVVITGGSRGLGLVMARLFAQEGAHLAILARDSAELARAAEELRLMNAAVLVIPCDVSMEEEVQSAIQKIYQTYGQIDILINNAGVIQVGPLEHMKPEDFEMAMNVHFWGPFYTSMAVWEQMRQQGGGRIVNISSIGGAVAVPHLAPYTVSKYALVGLSDVLRAELAKDNIHITTVLPGLMRTGSHVNALFKGHQQAEYTWFSVSGALPFLTVDAENAGQQILEACRYGLPHLTISLPASLLRLANAFLPSWLGDAMKVTNRLLPRPDPIGGDVAQPGRESQSALSPSVLTTLSDQAVQRNNEQGEESLQEASAFQ